MLFCVIGTYRRLFNYYLLLIVSEETFDIFIAVYNRNIVVLRL